MPPPSPQNRAYDFHRTRLKQRLEIQCLRFLTTLTSCPDGYVYKPKPVPNFSRQLSLISPSAKTITCPTSAPFRVGHVALSVALWIPLAFRLTALRAPPTLRERFLGHPVPARDFGFGYPLIT